MANWCFCTYRIGGDRDELDNLYNLMKKIEKENRENGNWAGYIMEELFDIDSTQLYLRGFWEDLTQEEDCIHFRFECAWGPYIEEWDRICGAYRTLRAYFSCYEPGMGITLKRGNPKKGWYPERFCLDMRYPDGGDDVMEYFNSIKDVYAFIEQIAGRKIKSRKDVDSLQAAWEEEDDDTFIFIRPFKKV